MTPSSFLQIFSDIFFMPSHAGAKDDVTFTHTKKTADFSGQKKWSSVEFCAMSEMVGKVTDSSRHPAISGSFRHI